MLLPEGILFDYGHTLIYEGPFDGLAGWRALLPYLDNPRGVTAETLLEADNAIFNGPGAAARAAGAEVPQANITRGTLASLGLTTRLSPLWQEILFWEASCVCRPMPGVDGLLALLEERGIPWGVVSNLAFSGEALAFHIRRYLPDRHPAFVLASSDITLRKPAPGVFQAALAALGLPGERVWFCGDNVEADVEGASAAGLYPVWYDSPLDCPYRTRDVREPACPHLRIRDWSELEALFTE